MLFEFLFYLFTHGPGHWYHLMAIELNAATIAIGYAELIQNCFFSIGRYLIQFGHQASNIVIFDELANTAKGLRARIRLIVSFWLCIIWFSRHTLHYMLARTAYPNCQTPLLPL